MRFQVERDALAEAVAWVSRALPARPVIPVLSGLLLDAADGLTLSCFDYEVSARVRVEAKVVEPGTALVPGRLLAEITRSLPSLPAEFADDPDGVSLTCGSAAFTLVTLPVDEYPDLPGLPQAAGTVDGGALAAAIGQVAPAASRDDTLPLLTGVNVEVDGETMTLAATDRYRLAVRELPWSPAQPGTSGAFLVPARTLADAARTMAAGSPVTIKLQSDSADAMIGFESGGRRLTTRLIAGEFIKYRSRFPADFGCRADLPAGPFVEAVRRVSLVAERGSAVRLVFGSGTVAIEAGTQGRARARETVPAEFTGSEPEIAFSPHFLLDGITAAGAATAPAAARPSEADPGGAGGVQPSEPADPPDRASAVIRLEFSSATKPAVITGVRGRSARPDSAGTEEPAAPDFRYLVVPLRAPARQ
jgi:DNA polymerase-3 subunit beta